MKRVFTQAALATGILLCLSQGAYANGINSPAGINVEIGAGGTPNVITVTGAGQVGLNNPSPGYTLDVNGDTNIGGNLYVTGQQNTGARIFMQRDGGNFSWVGAQGTATDAQRDAIGFSSESGTGIIDNVYINTSGALQLPSGSTAQEPAAPTPGMTRFNADTGRLEFWNGSEWAQIGSALAYSGFYTLSPPSGWVAPTPITKSISLTVPGGGVLHVSCFGHFHYGDGGGVNAGSWAEVDVTQGVSTAVCGATSSFNYPSYTIDFPATASCVMPLADSLPYTVTCEIFPYGVSAASETYINGSMGYDVVP